MKVKQYRIRVPKERNDCGRGPKTIENSTSHLQILASEG
jgi:hypothetical protein